MGKQKTASQTDKQEQEIMSILLSSSLYGEMSQDEKDRLLQYLVRSYFESQSSGEKSQARPKVVRNVPGT